MKVTPHGGVAVIALEGWFGEESQIAALDRTVLELLNSGNRCLVIDLAPCRQVNEAAVGAVVRVWSKYAEAGGRAVLSGLSKRLRTLSLITLRHPFDVYETLDQALVSFREGQCPHWEPARGE